MSKLIHGKVRAFTDPSLENDSWQKKPNQKQRTDKVFGFVKKKILVGVHGFTWYPHQKNIHITLHVREKKDLIFLPLLSNIWVCVWLCMCERERGWVCVCAREGMNTRPNIVGVAASQSRHATFFFFLSVFSTSSLFFPSTLSHHTQQRTAREWVCVHVHEWVCMSECVWERERESEREREREIELGAQLSHTKNLVVYSAAAAAAAVSHFS